MGSELVQPDLPDSPPPERDPSVQWDWRTNTSVCFPSPRSQGKCGSCWAFASSTVMAQRTCITAKSSKSYVFSAQQILDCDNTCEGNRCQQGCNGGYTDLVWKYMQTTGTTSATCMPYEGKKLACNTQTCKGSGPYEPVKSINGYRLSTVRKMQADIEQYGPIMVSMMVKEDFLDYSSGIYVASSSARDVGGHAVTLLGWGRDGNTDYWIGENSWGSSWGLNGYFKIRRGTNEVQIESYATAANVDGQTPSTNNASSLRPVMLGAAAVFLAILVLLL
eukprot:CAMPEP_0114557338 /NCGR_PEP_ID=MMETSP0114-20121206/9778_1 /TAXON_ID=31324 /ORGANISM="Goniomonas sp, Strain m" /LENGTH=276 /DNA_ID=CAMNT_0001742621 /DNA_START=177 /DNA_END=1007 /DNA_ORIENTATION=+